MKKKLLPALLALVMVLGLLPMAVFAEDVGGGTTPTTPAGTQEDPYEITASSLNEKGVLVFAKAGYYKLSASISPVTIYAYSGDSSNSALTDPVTIDLNGFDITQVAGTDDADNPLIYADDDFGDLAIVNSDTTKTSTLTSLTKVYSTIQVQGTKNSSISVENVTLKNTATDRADTGYALAVSANAANKAITMKNCDIEDINGLTINGLAGDNVTIELDQVNITATESGLYLAGPGTTTIKGGEIKGDNLGVEIRAGVLNVQNNAQIKGGEGEPTCTGNGSGSTTTNAGIAVAQHTTAKPITVNIADGAQVSGGSALYVANPQENVATSIDQTVTVSGTGTTLTSTHTDDTTGAKGNAVYAQAPVDIVIKEGAKLEGNVTMKKDDKNANKGGVDITGATVDGRITNESGDGAAVTVRQSTVTGEITDVGIIVGCKDGNGAAINDKIVSNTSLKAEETSAFANSFPGMWDVEVSGLQNDKYYLIRVAAAGISSTADGNSIIIALNDPTDATYTVTCKPGQNVSVFELEEKPTDWTGTIPTLTEIEMTVKAGA